MNKAQIDQRVLSIFQALIQEHGKQDKERILWCEKKAQQARIRLMQEAREEAKKRNAR